VHVERERAEAKFWLDPVRFQRSYGFWRAELRRVGRLVHEHRDHLLRGWDEYFHD